MIFADASALVAILNAEPQGPAFAARLGVEAGDVWISAVVRYEVVTAMAMIRVKATGRTRMLPDDVAGATALLDDLLASFRAQDLSITAEIARLALDAASRFGKLAGHPARLNMGDCFAHACATSLGASLLYKGEDFARTDLA